MYIRVRNLACAMHILINLEDYRDIESLNAYKELTETCGVSHEEMMGYLKRISRDNTRTPMQWDDSAMLVLPQEHRGLR